MKLCEWSQCSFQHWYPKFKNSSILAFYEPIPEEVLDYLKKDNVTVPTEAILEHKANEDSDSETSSINWEVDDEDQTEITPPSFPEFSNKLKDLIDRLGGNVFVKLNWSAPSDAAWIATNNSLKCTNLQDLYLLLKSSDKISKDISQDYRSSGPKYYIVLKKWKNIPPESEFRCFVIDNQLIAISQRNKIDYHEHISQWKLEIVKDIKDFFNAKVKNTFTLSNYCLDVVRSSTGSVKIIDFQPINSCLNTYLFTFDEIVNMKFEEEISPEFRYIAEHTGIQPNMEQHFGIPRDLIDLPEESRNDIIRFLQEQANQDLRNHEDEE